MDSEAARWVAEIGDDLAAKLAAVGLIAKRGTATLEGYCRSYIDGRTDIKRNTRINLELARRYLVDHFGSDRPLREVTAADADQWAISLRKRFSQATIARMVKRARQFFTAARRARLITENPFETVAIGQMDNRERLFFVTQEMTAKLIEAAPDAEWRALIALCRFGGLRCPSELLTLTWSGIDWERGRFLVHSPKLEHTATNGKRWVPLFPELRDHLEARSLIKRQLVRFMSLPAIATATRTCGRNSIGSFIARLAAVAPIVPKPADKLRDRIGREIPATRRHTVDWELRQRCRETLSASAGI